MKNLSQEDSVRFISEFIMLGIECAFILAFLYIAYVIYLRSKEQSRPAGANPRWIHFFALAILALTVLETARWAAKMGDPAAAALFLTIGAGGGAWLHFGATRASLNDERIRFSLIICAALTMLCAATLFFMWWAGTKLVYETPFKIDGQTFSQLLNNAAQIIGVLIAAAMIVVTNSFNAKQNQSNARQQIYQTLETQSIELFRFEAQHPELVSAFWEPEEFARMDTSAMLLKAGSRSFQYQLRQYVCQMLNLFEMAFRFRRDEIAPADVFSSWIVWMWEVAAEPRFRELWPGPSGLHLNYIRDFSEVMTFAMERALQLPDAPAEDELNRARQDFADLASIRLGGCPELAGWFTGNSKPAPPPPARLA